MAKNQILSKLFVKFKIDAIKTVQKILSSADSKKN